MSNCLNTLDGLGGWEDDLEIEELPSVQSATTIIIIIIVHLPYHGPLTTIMQPT
jgi:hypothetical protein